MGYPRGPRGGRRRLQLMGHYADLEGGGQAAAQSWEKARESVRSPRETFPGGATPQAASSVGIDSERSTDGRCFGSGGTEPAAERRLGCAGLVDRPVGVSLLLPQL